jgi:hypothetical protein
MQEFFEHLAATDTKFDAEPWSAFITADTFNIPVVKTAISLARSEAVSCLLQGYGPDQGVDE